MTPQLQRYRTRGEANAHNTTGDCWRTCIAMVLDMDRDDVPHFCGSVPVGTPVDHPLHIESSLTEKAWLAERGMVMVPMAFHPDTTMDIIREHFAMHAPDAAVILLCSFGHGVNHVVVLYNGDVYDPLGQMDLASYKPGVEGVWWVYVIAKATKPLPPEAAPASVATQEEV